MTDPSEDLLATTEGVDEGSAASTVEGATSTEELTGVTNPIKRALGDAPERGAAPSAQPAPPVEMESEKSVSAKQARGTGQQLEAGEG